MSADHNGMLLMLEWETEIAEIGRITPDGYIRMLMSLTTNICEGLAS